MEAETPSKSLETLSDDIAIKWGVSTSTLRNLVWSESRWNPNATSTTNDRGLVMINRDAWPEITDEQAFDPEFSLNFAAEKISQKKEDQWTVCNCYSLVKTRIRNLPKMAEITPNIGNPLVGGVAIFNYKGVKHVAYITKVYDGKFDVIEANLKPCLVAPREVSIKDPFLVGYWYKP